MSVEGAAMPLSKLLSQGWEVVNYSAALDPNTAMLLHCFLVRKGNQAKVVTVRKKILGDGFLVEETEV
jgi:hypothetical protein